MKIIFIFTISLFPSLLSLLILEKAQQRWQSRLARARIMAAYRLEAALHRYRDQEDLTIAKTHIGDLSCRFNARSPYIRCAINPSGPCENCAHYQK